MMDTKAMLMGLPEIPSSDESYVFYYKPRIYELNIELPINRTTRISILISRSKQNSNESIDQDLLGDYRPLSKKIPTQRQAGEQEQHARSSTHGLFFSSGNRKRAFCTQFCLQGLARGGPLDRGYPNIADHYDEGY